MPRYYSILRVKAGDLRLLLPAAYRGQNPVVEQFAALGAQVRYENHDFDGLMMIAHGTAGKLTGLLGSIRLTGDSLNKAREVAVKLSGASTNAMERIFVDAWGTAR